VVSLKVAVAVALALAICAISFSVAFTSPAFAWASTPTLLVAEVVLVALAVMVALIDFRRGVSWVFCAALVMAAASWSWVEWASPGASSSIVFIVGQVSTFAGALFLSLAGENYPITRAGTPLATLLALAGAVVLGGLVPAFLLDPARQGCSTCPSSAAAAVAPAVADAITRASFAFGALMVLGSVGVLAYEAARMSTVRRNVLLPILIPASAGLVVIALELATSARLGYVSSGANAVRLWELTGVAVLMTLVGAMSAWVRSRQQRHAVAHLVADLVATDATGDLRDALATDLDEPLLAIAYPIDQGNFWVDAVGRSIEPAADAVRIVAGGQTLAVVSHAPRLADDPSSASAVARGAMLALERERLQAQTLWRRREIQASRARIVEVGDAERQRLERDLHDGAQQRLAALSLELRLRRDSSPVPGPQLDEARAEVSRALSSLREIAHGIYPAALAEEGLSAALETLTEISRPAVRLVALPSEDLRGPGAMAVYFCAVEATRDADAATVTVTELNGFVTLTVCGAVVPWEIAQAMTDRVLAVHGQIHIADDEVRVEVPCG
jgi:signal transduction histidine kinase